ncbi:hypothetical protein Tco_0910321 [Tanacetum coccineum]|uniref:Uncharacterized protein n=1 Tax=Tanacetum coccineum TaxID=301880 RepID=A0ABQ5CVV4_9ASTR
MLNSEHTMENHKPLLKDFDGEDVDETLYRSMIRLIDVSYFFKTRYKCLLVGCKMQTVVANSTTKAEYIAASSCYGQVLWIQNQLLDYRDSNEKKLIQMIKIHTDKNVVHLLTKAFDKGIGVNAGDSKLMLLGINLLLLVKVNAATHNLLLLVPIIMSALKFADSHNMVAFLAKPTESDGFEEILDYLNANPIKYALTVNPTIYTSCIRQFWATTKVKTVNGEVQLQALVDGKKVIITETSVRRDLKLEDVEGIKCLPNADISEQLALMGAKSTTWNEFSSTMASVIICLATNQKFNFSKYIFESMVKNMDTSVKFLMYPRFVQVFLDKLVGDISTHDEIFVTPSHTKKVFGEGSTMPTDPHHTPIIQPSTSQPQKKQSRRKQRKDTKIPQSNSPIEPIADEAANEENVPIQSNDPPLSRVNTLGNGEDRLTFKELTDLCLGDGWKIDDIDQDAEVTLVNETQGRYDDAQMFDTNVFNGEEVFVVEQSEKVIEEVEVSTAATIITEEITLAQALAALKSAKPKVNKSVSQKLEQGTTKPTATPTTATTKGILLQEPSETRTTTKTTTTPITSSMDKGKGIMVEEPLKMKPKDQVLFDEQEAIRMQAQFNEEERIAREKEEANAALIAQWNDIQDKVETDYELAQRMQAEEQEELTIE